MSLLLLLVLLAPSLGQDCGPVFSCLPQDQCPDFHSQREEFESLSRGSVESRVALAALKARICDSRQKLVCCCPSERCGVLEDCPGLQQDYRSFQGNDPGLKKAAKDRLQALICDKGQKHICCPPSSRSNSPSPSFFPSSSTSSSSTSSPSSLPSLGSCGVVGDAANIVGGEKTKPGEFPWAALVGSKRVKKRIIGSRVIRYEEVRWGCGGVLINTWFVLTAAHCQGGTERTRIRQVRLGEWNVAGYSGEVQNKDNANLPDEQDFEIGPGDVTVHSGYSTLRDDRGDKIIQNDLALIRLPRQVELNSGVQLVCLPTIAAEYRQELGVANLSGDLEGREATVVGWGYTSGYDPWAGGEQEDDTTYGVPSREQWKLSVPLLSSEQCGWRRPTTTQVCAGGDPGKSSCLGDSGGGLYIQNQYSGHDSRPWYLLGIVSYGSKYCDVGSPGIYSRVEEFIPWIRETIRS